MHDFRSEYKEALDAFGKFQGHLSDTLLGCSENSYFHSIQSSFKLADEQYKKINLICNDLVLWHAAKVESKKFSAWTQQEHEENVLVRSLLGAISGLMNALLTSYRLWLAKAQFSNNDENRSA